MNEPMTPMAGDMQHPGTAAEEPVHPADSPPEHTDGKVRELASRAGQRLESVGWIEVAAGAAIGLGIGYLLGSRRSNETLADIFSDSIRPWASRHLHDAVEPVRSSRPACGLASMVNRLKNS